MDPFLAACGATGPLEFTVECPGAPGVETVTFDQPFVLIGRDPKSDLRFPHAEVSERHVYVQVVGGHLCYVDLGSRAGTYLEGRCLRSGWLPLNKTLRIGPYRVRLAAGIADALAPPGADTAPAAWALEVLHRGLRRARSALGGDLTLVGSSADCDVRLLDPSVSNYHASLLRTGEGVWVVDLLGLRGIMVNGEPVRSARLADGDELRLGQSIIRVQGDGRTGAPADDLAPLAARLPSAPAGELVDTFLGPLVDQFRLMQRELCDDLRRELSDELGRAREELVRSVAAAQREHAESLGHELEQFRRLNRELDALKAALAAHVPEAPVPAPAAARPTRLGTAVAVPVSRPFPFTQEPALAAAAPSDPGPDAPITPEEAQSWLYQRISMIQDEQQGRWQKLLETLPGQLLGRLPV
jgi:pSer/pThr/pTyr-binding forkhead associated (FHA) protein